MHDLPELTEVSLDDRRWGWGDAAPVREQLAGRACLAFPEALALAAVAGLELEDGIVELDLAVSPERSFHGLAWHVRDQADYESFYVRPHQVGNPDAIQYTPVTNDISAWQLYHGDGFWAPIAFPVGDWFTIRVVSAGTRAEIYVAGLGTPALEVAELKHGAAGGGIGISVGGPGLRVARFAYAAGTFPLQGPMLPPIPRHAEVVPAWHVSEPFAEAAIADALRADHAWTRLEAEPSGLVDLARAGGITADRNTVLARATIRSSRVQVKALEVGFSDRAVVFLNGQPLFRGEDTYRSRDYRFLGSIGYWDTVYLPLREGGNELVVAVSETFGGWGVQGRLEDLTDVAFA